MCLQARGVKLRQEAQAPSVDANHRRCVSHENSQRSHDAAVATNDHGPIGFQIGGQRVVHVKLTNHGGVPSNRRADLRQHFAGTRACA